VSNLLLITDVARLRKIFGRLTEDRNVRLRVVNNLEKGGEEIALEKPDIVFVQTYISGLSPDILLMHLKKQLGRKRSRFVLMAAPGQVNDAALKPYQGWLDTSVEDSQLLPELQRLLVTLLNKSKSGVEIAPSNTAAPVAAVPQQPSPGFEESAAIASSSTTVVPPLVNSDMLLAVTTPPVPELSLEEQGITYAPRQRLKVYSEFNSSFDNAFNDAHEPAALEQLPPALPHDWSAEQIDTLEAKSPRSKRGTFLLWLVPVVVAVVVITYFQQKPPPHKAEPVVTKTVPAPVAKPPVPPSPTPTPTPPVIKPAIEQNKVATAVAPAPPQTQDRLSDKAVLSAIAENRAVKSPPPPPSTTARPASLPDFIPRYTLDKQFSIANPGWERYKGRVTEFKVLREDKTIKAIQVIDRGGNGVPESFMKAALRQVAKAPSYATDSSEKKDGYDVQRGNVSDTIKVVYYRDEDGGKLRAFVLTWH
jgi:flagellar FliL protein